MRKSRSNGSTTYNYVYNGGKLIQMTRGADTLEFYYDALGVPVIVKYNGEVYNYVTTLQGDVLLILDTDGEIAVEYAYDAWGGHVTVGGSMASTLGTLNPLTYRGYVYDRETGLYYLQSRYYNPEIGRFINADVFIATGQGLTGNNMFAYCQNNASMLSDPTGTIEADCISSEANPFVDSWRSVGSGGGLITAAFTCVVVLLIVNESRVVPKAIVKKTVEKTEKRNNSVYVLKDNTGTVQYVGRTNNVIKRAAAHKANPARAGLEMEILASGLTLDEARALEQAGMAYYHTINTANKMNNQINSVAPKYWGVYKELALGTLDYVWNQMTNEILFWTGN